MNIFSEGEIGTTNWVDWSYLFLLGIISPIFLFPSTKYLWLILLVPFVWIFQAKINNQFLVKTILDWPIALLSVQVLATCFIVPDIEFSLPKISGVLYGILVFYALSAILTHEITIKLGIVLFLVSGCILSILGILGMQWDLSDPSGYLYDEKFIVAIEKSIPRIRFNLPGAELGFNSNALGGTLVLILPLCLILLISLIAGRKSEYLFSPILFPSLSLSLIALLMCGSLFFTMSIASWLAFLLSIWILFFSKKWKKWSAIIVAVLLVLVLFGARAKTKTAVLDKLEYDFSSRFGFWKAGVNTIIQYPIWGIGMNQIRKNPAIGYHHSHAHNQFIHTAAELGIPGLIAYLAILIGTGYMVFQIWRKSEIVWMKKAALGLGGGQLAHLIFGLGDSIPLGAKVGIFFWISLAFITGVYNYTIKQELLEKKTEIEPIM